MELNREEIMQECNKKYQEGMIIDSLGGLRGHTLNGIKNCVFSKSPTDIIIFGFGVTLYRNGVWAKIISKNSNKLINYFVWN